MTSRLTGRGPGGTHLRIRVVPSTTMDFRILGNLSVLDGDDEVVIAGARSRLLLAVLLVRRGEIVSTDRLVDELWGDSPPAGFQNALQSLVSKLRRRLGPAGDLLRSENNGYRLDVSVEQIDAGRFTALAEQGHEALISGDPMQAAALLTDALALWRGDALDGVAFEGLLQREATRLEELRLAAIEDRCDCALQLGRHAEMIAEMSALVAAHPMRERLHGFLMLALYRCGRQADALRVYQAARTVFADELGLDPGPELRALEAAIIAQEAGLDRPATVQTNARRPSSNLMPALSSFVGRSGDVGEVDELVTRNRLLTIVGTGGAGKTRLAVEVGLRRRAVLDVWMVELAPLVDPAGIADAVAAALGIGSNGPGGSSPVVQSALEGAIDFLVGREALIILDNCEHVIDGAARVAERITGLCPMVRILATSREALGVPGEQTWPIPPMPLEDVVSLFVDRASAASSFTPSDESADEVRDLCSRLDGLPLAVELAAGRVRAIPVRQLASRLDDRFRLLTGGSRTALPRQQTLRAVVSWSYDLLFADEQCVFDRLSVFAGGCSLEAAEAVCAGDDIPIEEVSDLLARLVDKSLVVVDQSGDSARFHLLQTLALFGRERLAESGDAVATHQRHAAHFAALSARGWDAFLGIDQVDWLAQVRREADNVNAALTWASDRRDLEMVERMTSGLGWSWMFSPRHLEGWRWLHDALGNDEVVSVLLKARIAMWAAWGSATGGHDLDAAREHGEQSVAMLRSLPNAVDDLAMALGIVGLLAAVRGDASAALAAYDEAIALTERTQLMWVCALRNDWEARAASLRGDTARAHQFHRESAQRFEEAGMHWAAMFANGDLAMVEERRGDLASAIADNERAVVAAQALNLTGFEALLVARQATFAAAAGDVDEATRSAARAIDLGDQTGNRRAVGIATHVQSTLALGRRDLDEARDLARAAEAILRQTGPATVMLLTLVTGGLVAELGGDTDAAWRLHREASTIAMEANDARATALALEGLAGALVARGPDTDCGRHAAMLLGVAAEIRSRGVGGPGYAGDLDRISAAVAAVFDGTTPAGLIEAEDAVDLDSLLAAADVAVASNAG